MNIKFRQLKAFSLTARLGSFSQAAAALSVTQPSLSALIKELESDLGVVLFERTTRSCLLTAAGTAFYEQIARPLEEIEVAYLRVVNLAKADASALRLGVLTFLSSGLCGAALAKFYEQHPRIKVLIREPKYSSEIYELIRRREIDIGVCSAVPDNDLTFKLITKDRLVAVMRRDHELAADPARLDWSAVARYPYIAVKAGAAEWFMKQAQVSVVPKLEVDNHVTAISMARRGTGVTAVLASAVATLDMSDLVCIPLPGDSMTWELGIVYDARADMPAGGKHLIELLLKG